ncbi:BnaA09g19800D [Brassica napus]|uniref:BnaA09g19800D protein n=1 Tax=Brassica napus TaxID=3708 RepID=A0A078I911_BRANA|nr:BnaA09g19800D [Brassica napus]
MIVDPDQSSVDLQEGPYFFVNRTASSGRTDGCDGGCWRIMRRDRVIISKRNKVLGFKRLFKFCVKGEAEPVYKFWADEKYKVNELKVTWVMDEYRLAKKKEQGKVICRIRLLFPLPLKCHLKHF